MGAPVQDAAPGKTDTPVFAFYLKLLQGLSERLDVPVVVPLCILTVAQPLQFKDCRQFLAGCTLNAQGR